MLLFSILHDGQDADDTCHNHLLIGYLVLGPDYFFGDYMHNHTEPDFLEQRDDWFLAKLKAARAAFPAWFSAVKGQYGMCLLDSIVSCTNISLLFKEVTRCIALPVSITYSLA